MGWDWWRLLPDGLCMRDVTIEVDRVTVSMMSTAESSACPLCGRASSNVHRYCERTLADLPWAGRVVQLRVRARHFYCRNPCCLRKTFSERLTGIASVYARRTDRCVQKLLGLAYELGGEAGSRQARDLGMPASGDTLLRLIRRAPLPDAGHPAVLGVDDWCWRKRRSYGTILVDLERHRPVDMLPDRNSASFAGWLREHPGIAIIARDRGNIYAEGASEGAPGAVQVADRWHLLRNLGEVIERFLARKHTPLRVVAQALREEALGQAAAESPQESPKAESPGPPAQRSPTRNERDKQRRRDARKARYDEVVALHKRGLSLRQIARTLGLGRVTVRRFVHAGAFPERAAGARGHRPSALDPHEGYLRGRWDAGCQNAAELCRELRGRGYAGSEASVRYYVRRWKDGVSKPGKPAKSTRTRPAPKSTRTYPPRRAAWLLSREAAELDTQDQAYVERLCRTCPEVEIVRSLALKFRRMVCSRDRAALGPWLREAKSGGVEEIAGFAQGIRRDLAAVESALSTQWSAGQTEGNINRLKLIKRSMYGRAGFDLLCARVLHHDTAAWHDTRVVFGMPPPLTLVVQ